ncbi:unnamed protein product [Cuscuta epithymum]|uniref:Uncharacterized protein n=1 Tax=Cuscuta epithymum TaxID=186058 RepID=A0AAV0D0D7_9ASTE|nr:unnamed protein product [Cuscuta epithymum]CAH9124842.1 unnamed protein product [Cuscuta epithymum]
MEKTPQDPKPATVSAAADGVSAGKTKQMWDCGSSLYDSFELRSFERQLNSAIDSRSFSMPHLPDNRSRRTIQLHPPPPPKGAHSSPSSKISRSFQKLLKSVFRHKPPAVDGNGGAKQQRQQQFRAAEASRDGLLKAICEKPGDVPELLTIPEVPEYNMLSPEIRSLVRRTPSERFMASSTIGISCA